MRLTLIAPADLGHKLRGQAIASGDCFESISAIESMIGTARAIAGRGLLARLVGLPKK